MLERLAYVDMVRGFACLFMVIFQLGDMFSIAIDYGSMHWFPFFNWVPFFFVIAGFSAKLMFQKYNLKKFIRKVVFRFGFFLAIGLFLIFWVNFQVNTIFDEVVASIGLNLLLLTPFVTLFSRHRTLDFLGFSLLCISMLLLNHFYHLEGAFNVFWSLSFMSFGVALAYLKDKPSSWLFFTILTLPFIAFSFPCADYYSRNFEFWLSNSSFVAFVLWLLSFLQNKISFVTRFLGYFGKHSLFFYFFHFAIFRKLLLVLNVYKGFDVYFSVFATFCSIGVLVLIEKLRSSLLYFKGFIFSEHRKVSHPNRRNIGRVTPMTLSLLLYS